MKLLDEKGLTTVWAAIKNTFLTKSDASSYATKTEVENAKKWVSNSFMLLTGGTINGGIDLIHDNGTVHTQLDAAGITVSDSESDDQVEIHRNEIISPSFRIPYGTGDQVLVANGYTKEIGSANGIAGLDSNGYVPLDQLGNLDTTVAEVVAALPTTNIKKHIYLIKDANGTTQNQYAEYIYTGDTSATYDSSKWEKLGTYTATVDLADYAKKSEAMYSTVISHNRGNIHLEFDDINGESLAAFELEAVTGDTAGVMLPADKIKLDMFDTSFDKSNAESSINVGKLLTVDYQGIMEKGDIKHKEFIFNTLSKSTSSLYITSASPHLAGLMSGTDKVKLDGIATGANNYTLPTASDTTLGGIKTGFGSKMGVYWKVDVDEQGNAYASIGGLHSDSKGKIGYIDIEGSNIYGPVTTYRNSGISSGFPGKQANFTFPSKSGTLALESDLMKANYSDNDASKWPVKVDNNNNAYVPINGLSRGDNNTVTSLSLGTSTGVAYYGSYGINFDTQHGAYSCYFPTAGGTFALTSDIPNVSDLCKINFVDRPSNCVEGRINMFTTTDRSISLNNIQDYGEGLILLLGCYSDSQYTIYCTDSDLYYKGVLVDDGYRENITRAGMYLVTIKGTSVYVYPLG